MYLERVRVNAQRMGALIDDLLALSRVSRHDVDRRLVDVSQIAAAIAARLHEQEPARQVEWRILPNLVASADAGLVHILLENLLGNAWKFSSRRERAVIEFGTADAPEGRAFVVRDNGAGFDMAYAGKLFGAFQRLHAETEFPGTGIGLATVQRIVHKHGGRAWAEGREDGGASFYFTLAPSAAPDGVEADAPVLTRRSA
jgi:light-regulated signal transduction histidine kinase (bacteriophytochrome)